MHLDAQNVPILGTAAKDIDNAEDRAKFSQMLTNNGINQPEWSALTSMEDIDNFIERVGFPVLVRPSYVLSGAAMNVCSNEEELKRFLQLAANVSEDHPVVVSKFIEHAKEIEMDAVAKNGEVIAYAISEHIEFAGVHSGDATIQFPPQKLYVETVRRVKRVGRQIAKELHINGPFNIQFMARDNDILVIECNLRASRLEGKSKEAVETNKDIGQLLLSIQKAFDVLVEKRTDFEAKDVKEALQGSVKTQTTLLSFVDEHISELSTHEGIDMSKSSVWTYRKIRKNLAEFIGEKYRLTDLAFGQLTEPFISDFHHYLLDEKGFSSGTITIYVSLFKKMCRIAFERGLCKNLLFAHYWVGTPKVTTPKALSMSDFIKIRDAELPEDKPRLSMHSRTS